MNNNSNQPHEIDIDRIYDEVGKQNMRAMDMALKNLNREPTSDRHETIQCSYRSCTTIMVFPDDFTCKFCHLKFCAKHIQLENHECAKTVPVKYVRKTWLRKYGLNISSGSYIVVCDQCGYVSQKGSLIDIAGQERENHISNQGCNPKKVFLEEDLSYEEIPKILNVEESVPSDRPFWVCSHCRPPQKFMRRQDYISHHYAHS